MMDITKICKRCGEYKPVAEFSKDKSKGDGLCSNCKACAKSTRKAWYDNNRDYAIKKSHQWQSDNRDRYAEGARARRNANRGEHLAKRRARHKLAYRDNQNYVTNHRMRAMLRRHVASGGERTATTSMSLGYTPEQFRSRMEVQFKKGMSWDNYGEWEVDHKIPMSVMIARGERRPEIVNALSNLQPLWKKENRSKGARWVG